MNPPSFQGPSEHEAGPLTTDREQFVQLLADWYRERLNGGTAPDRGELVSLYPEIARELEGRLRTVDLLFGLSPGGSGPNPAAVPLPPEHLETTRFAGPDHDSRVGGGDAVAQEDVAVLRREGFQVVGRLGKGAFGRVYLARQPRPGRAVAVKVTSNQGSEGQKLADLQHDHIVKVHLEIEVPGRDLRILCMEYVPGPTLKDVIEQLVKLPVQQWSGRTIVEVIDEKSAEQTGLDPLGWRDRQQLGECDFIEAVCWLGTRLAGALAHAHRLHILHRDVKPANILLHPNGRPLLVDFNLAGALQGSSNEEMFGGTPLYMAPEHLAALKDGGRSKREAVDHRSDIYSLGVVLFELLTGQRPWGAVSSIPRHGGLEVLLEERGCEPPSPRCLRSEIPDVLDRVVRRCLDPNPERRYQTGDELAVALDGCRELHQMHKILDRAAGPLTRLALRHPHLVGLILPLLPHLVGALVVSGYQVTWVRGHPDQEILSAVFRDFSLWYCSVAFPVTGAITCWLTGPIWRTCVQLRNSAPLAEGLAARMRRRALNKPFWGVLLSSLGWLPGAVFLPLQMVVQAGDVVGFPELLHAFLSFLIAGMIALMYTEFIDQFLLLTVAYPFLWIDPHHPRQTACKELGPVERRLRFFQILSVVIPLATGMALMLGLVSVDPERRATAEYQTFLILELALMGLGIAGCCLAVMVSGYLGQVLKALRG